MGKQQEDVFINNPSITELKEELALVDKIIGCQSQGMEVKIKEGKVTVDMGNGIIESIGTIPDLAETAATLFGEGELPKGVEYIKLDGITFMTYKGHLVACGDGSSLEKSALKESLCSLDSIVNSDLALIYI